tara:strand:+ start:1790 stop:2617 length:828 start_codon:yes stop_codon:yes gene_type:complete
MSKGFVLYANGTDYVLQACLAAMSIKSKNDTPISIITINDIPKKYKDIFDEVISPLWIEHDDSRYNTLNRWKIYHNSPYEETIVLDTDVLVLQNIDLWWNFFENYDIFYLSKVFNYRSVEITSTIYRKAFVENNLPNLYSGFHYFKKSEKAKEFFSWLELISKNWELFYGQYCKEFYPENPSMDLSCAIASKILNNDMEITNKKVDFLKFIHMKSKLQGWKKDIPLWKDKVGSYLTADLKFYVGNYFQTGIFHYASQNFVDSSITKKYEKYLGII